jgi:hypothetical protein
MINHPQKRFADFVRVLGLAPFQNLYRTQVTEGSEIESRSAHSHPHVGHASRKFFEVVRSSENVDEIAVNIAARTIVATLSDSW